MGMNQVAATIARINQKLQLLIKKHEQLQRDYEKLQQELAQRDLQLQEQQNKQLLLENQLAALQTLTQKPLDDKEKKILEKKINGFIKDIDRVIAQLQTGE
jgi:chromosome segregation ATPase